MPRCRVGLTVYTEDPEVVARVAESMARTAAGLALDGVDTFLAIGPDSDDES